MPHGHRYRRDILGTLPGGSLDPNTIPKYQTPLVIPPAMPRTRRVRGTNGEMIEYYEIGVRQFQQQILPASLPATTVWSYGSVNHPGTFNYPSFTIEAKTDSPVRVRWINELMDANRNYLPHLLPVDQTLHWANPPGPRDSSGMSPAPYTGPVPMVTHVHGAHTTDESDGYTEAWYLPDAANIPPGYFRQGTWYKFFRDKFASAQGHKWRRGSASFQYPNSQRATTLWFHDHTLGMTSRNVYAGPAGFYLLRGGSQDLPLSVLPGPAPSQGDQPGLRYYEIPIAIQDRAFNLDGALFYPDNRAFFEGLNQPPTVPYLDIPFVPDTACDNVMSDVAPIHNPEFFGNTMVVNGSAWPVLNVEPRRYRFRLLDGCNARYLILKITSDPTARPGTPVLPFWQIGSEGGFLPAPVPLNQLLMSPAERADVIVDFTGLTVGTELYLINEGPDEPFQGGVGGVNFAFADPPTTGQIMKFVVVPLVGRDRSLPPSSLTLPARTPLGPSTVTRQVTLGEEESKTVRVITDVNGNVVLACNDPAAGPFGPTAALCGTLNPDGTNNPLKWVDAITENPDLGATETWEIHNFTVDAHPVHVHVVMFEVVNREDKATGTVRPPEAWETGVKDTVTAYPGEITRLKALFNLPGQYVWHCHIVEHEDNEMMRPMSIGPLQTP